MATNGDLDRLEKTDNIRILEKKETRNSLLSDSFEEKIYSEAKEMSEYYMLFYCL
jgi:uncharacterized membrane protein